MRLSFRVLAIVSALTFFVLALVWLFAPGLLLTDWGVQVTSGVELVSRRAAALFAGLGVMLFSARNATPSPARSALIQGLMVAMAMLSVLGVYEWQAGHAGVRILAAVAVEVAMLLALAYVWKTQTARA
ncbi:MAG TPA: hypothetical protein VF670_13715 [Duganella sp.]|jgi:peptidoglycan/LPS O-acetylase OafA/YrhL